MNFHADKTSIEVFLVSAQDHFSSNTADESYG